MCSSDLVAAVGSDRCRLLPFLGKLGWHPTACSVGCHCGGNRAQVDAQGWTRGKAGRPVAEASHALWHLPESLGWRPSPGSRYPAHSPWDKPLHHSATTSCGWRELKRAEWRGRGQLGFDLAALSFCFYGGAGWRGGAPPPLSAWRETKCAAQGQGQGGGGSKVLSLFPRKEKSSALQYSCSSFFLGLN